MRNVFCAFTLLISAQLGAEPIYDPTMTDWKPLFEHTEPEPVTFTEAETNKDNAKPDYTDVDTPLNHVAISGMMLLMLGSVLRFKNGRVQW